MQEFNMSELYEGMQSEMLQKMMVGRSAFGHPVMKGMTQRLIGKAGLLNIYREDIKLIKQSLWIRMVNRVNR